MKPVSDAEIRKGLLSIDPQHSFYLALLAILEQEVEDEMSAACLPHLADPSRQFNAGRLAHARDLRTAIPGLMQEVRAEENARVLREQQLAKRQADQG
jgi:hypothetical protein